MAGVTIHSSGWESFCAVMEMLRSIEAFDSGCWRRGGGWSILTTSDYGVTSTLYKVLEKIREDVRPSQWAEFTIVNTNKPFSLDERGMPLLQSPNDYAFVIG